MRRRVDASRKSVRDGGGLGRLTITREADASWCIAGKEWNGGAGASNWVCASLVDT